jgi:uncharacterized Zn-binding protein involved in type VI secretion
MPGAHRQSDRRYCTATNKTLYEDVRVNGSPWTVDGQENTHDDGRLISVVGSTVRIHGQKVIVFGDTANSDDAGHPLPPTDPEQKSDNVRAYGD